MDKSSLKIFAAILIIIYLAANINNGEESSTVFVDETSQKQDDASSKGDDVSVENTNASNEIISENEKPQYDLSKLLKWMEEHEHDKKYVKVKAEYINPKGEVIKEKVLDRSSEKVGELHNILQGLIFEGNGSYDTRYIDYFFSTLSEAYDYVESYGDKNHSYVIYGEYNGYGTDLYISYKDEQWKAHKPYEHYYLTIKQLREGVEFPEEKVKETETKKNEVKENETKKDNGSCTLKEFLDMYGDDFDDEFEAEEYYEDWGCESW